MLHLTSGVFITLDSGLAPYLNATLLWRENYGVHPITDPITILLLPILIWFPQEYTEILSESDTLSEWESGTVTHNTRNNCIRINNTFVTGTIVNAIGLFTTYQKILDNNIR